jgi:hypothetical protein
MKPMWYKSIVKIMILKKNFNEIKLFPPFFKFWWSDSYWYHPRMHLHHGFVKKTPHGYKVKREKKMKMDIFIFTLSKHIHWKLFNSFSYIPCKIIQNKKSWVGTLFDIFHGSSSWRCIWQWCGLYNTKGASIKIGAKNHVK